MRSGSSTVIDAARRDKAGNRTRFEPNDDSASDKSILREHGILPTSRGILQTNTVTIDYDGSQLSAAERKVAVGSEHMETIGQ
jgi:hypothetical protein